MSLSLDIVRSWACTENAFNSNNELLDWIQLLNTSTKAIIKPCSIIDSGFWFYDDYNGEVLNRKRSFFSIKGMRLFINDSFICEQPIINQPEIGFLGIICKKIDGILHFLMQAKIEPGNINCVQISPTIQATKSNFMRVHGGHLPKYFEYFENADKYKIIYDQIQSEQGSRFYQKRNRNIIIEIEESDDIEIFQEFKWMTLGQIKKLMKLDNLVNMDTRTVLSGLPLTFEDFSKFELEEIQQSFKIQSMYTSVCEEKRFVEFPQVFHIMNQYKMFHNIHTPIVPLNQLVDWKVDNYGITSTKAASFEVCYYDIDIEGREVQRWNQPLFKSIGIGTFGLLVKKDKKQSGEPYKFLIKLRQEIGYCDKVEFGPAIQWESNHESENDDEVESLFRNKLSEKRNLLIDVLLSEEGGRFYHEQNRNVVMLIESNEIQQLPLNYIWVSYSTLNGLVQHNNVLNIQLRNLISLLDL